MRMIIFRIILLVSSLDFHILKAQKFSFDWHLGYANNLQSPLIVEQKGFPDIKINATYESEPFILPVYWLWRINYQFDSTTIFAFEAVHHKIYLTNHHPDIQRFSISHGLNLLIFNRIKSLKSKFHYNLGIGTVLAHPESTIRQKPFNEFKGIGKMGYYISGIALNVSAGKYFDITRRIYINFEARFNPSYSVVPIVDGKAYVWNYAYQIIGGIGIKLF